MTSRRIQIALPCILLASLVASAEAATLNVYNQAIHSQDAVVYYWPLDAGDVDDALGTFTGAATDTSPDADRAGRSDAALAFSGSGSEVDHSPNLTLPDAGTVEAYIKVDEKDAASEYFISARGGGGGGTDRFYLQKRDGGNIVTRFGNSGNIMVMPKGEYDAGDWRYVGFTWEKQGSNYEINTYREDDTGQVTLHTTSTAGGSAADDAEFVFGRYAWSSHERIDGSLDNVGIYDEVLDVRRLQSHRDLAANPSNPMLQNYQESVLATPGLIHYWPLDGQSTEDVVGTVDAGRAHGGVLTAPAANGSADSAMVFDGQGSYYNTTDTLTLGSEGTLELWVRPDALPDSDRGYVFSSRRTSPGQQADRMYITLWDDGELRYGFGDSADSGAIGDVGDRLGEWMYVALTWEQNGSNIDVATYLSDAEGQLLTGGNSTVGGLAPEDARVFLGRYSAGTQYLAGAVDEVAIYNRVLDFDEMSGHVGAMVPEPSAMALVLCGVSLLGACRCRRRR
jgi:hypothetical protein